MDLVALPSSRIVPMPELFWHPSALHGQAHVTRVLVHAFRLVEATVLEGVCQTTHTIFQPIVTIAAMKSVKIATRKPVRGHQSKRVRPVSDVAAQQVVADREAVRTEVSGIRAGAARLLDLFAYEAGQLLKDGTMVPEPSPTRASRGAVDAPGKLHRKPPAQERIAKNVVAPEGKKMGQKSVKNAMRRGRG